MKAWLVAGLGFGDEGKGSIVDFLCRRTGARLVVRYNGGPQAGHNVITPAGHHHTFAQFGSGTLAGARTHLSRFMLIEPYAMMNEASMLEKLVICDPLGFVTVDEACTIITPWHWKANQIKELARGDARHGSCGMGVGEARADELSGLRLTVSDVDSKALTVSLNTLKYIKEKKLRECREAKDSCGDARNIYSTMEGWDPFEVLADYRRWAKRVWIKPPDWLSNQSQDMVFEGAQGVLLDERYGFAPHNSWTDCTFGNADRLLQNIDCERIPIGVIRTYATRHGPGAFPTEDPKMVFGDPFNRMGPWQGPFRFGYFDAVLARYSIECLGGVYYLAVTHVDQVRTPWRYCNRYRINGTDLCWRLPANTTDKQLRSFEPESGYKKDFATEDIAWMLSRPVGIVSNGRTAEEKIGIPEYIKERP
jgi:adenylosuccinate synthase